MIELVGTVADDWTTAETRWLVALQGITEVIFTDGVLSIWSAHFPNPIKLKDPDGSKYQDLKRRLTGGGSY